FRAPPTPGIYTLSLHDALPISEIVGEASLVLEAAAEAGVQEGVAELGQDAAGEVDAAARAQGQREIGRDGPEHDAEGLDRGHAVDRKSTRLNSSHVKISYAVFC